MEKKRILIPLIVALTGILILLVGTSFAFFSANVTGNETAKETVITSGDMRLTFTDGEAVTLNNAVPGDSVTKTFSVENTGTLSTTYDLYFSELCNSFVDSEDLVYTLTSNNGGFSTLNEVEVPNTSGKINIASISINSGVTHTYTLTITFKNLDSNQDNEQGKSFNSKININTYKEVENCGSSSSAVLPANSIYNTILASESASITAHGNTAPAFGEGSSSDDGMYKAVDDLGDVYYYRGNIQDNYVSFAGFCWRVVRTNGDHSVRLIYQGTVCDETGNNIPTIDDDDSFNVDEVDNAYVGYMYGTLGASTYAETHANINSSNAKIQLENWYTNNLSTYDSLIADQIFCNDRSVSTEWEESTGFGYGTYVTSYGAYERAFTSKEFERDTSPSPTLICPQDNDKFTKDDTINGNGALAQKIGMLTYDEAIMAGGFGGFMEEDNSSYYLCNETSWWLGSPGRMYTNGSALVFYLDSNGDIDDYYASYPVGFRPVISLLPSAEVSSGNGTQSNPWVISTN